LFRGTLNSLSLFREYVRSFFYRSLSIRQQFLIAFRECAQSLLAYTEISAIFEGFFL